MTLPRQTRHTALRAGLAIWAGLTIIRQVRPNQSWLHQVERCGIPVPNYRFFGPNPAMHDMHLLIRHRLADGSFTSWQEVAVTENRHFSQLFWAPFRRMSKGMNDAMKELLVATRRTNDLRLLKETIPYRSFLNVASSVASQLPSARAAQFAIGRSAVFDPDVEPDIIFVSDTHEIRAYR
ncbi:hypothetical protein [Streptomyces sp. NPDC005799]|uniref:hypothetical protein n=1 Tax=Streptomyces sp. NPDC005799 TaxID=3154678 RepID=UPI00340296BC